MKKWGKKREANVFYECSPSHATSTTGKSERENEGERDPVIYIPLVEFGARVQT
jgi:hypothetical protein